LNLEDVRYWPKADMPKNAIDVAIGGKADIRFALHMSAFDPKRTSTGQTSLTAVPQSGMLP